MTKAKISHRQEVVAPFVSSLVFVVSVAQVTVNGPREPAGRRGLNGEALNIERFECPHMFVHCTCVANSIPLYPYLHVLALLLRLCLLGVDKEIGNLQVVDGLAHDLREILAWPEINISFFKKFGILKNISEILLDDRKHFGHEVPQQPGGVHDPLPRHRGRAGVGAWKKILHFPHKRN